VSSHAPKVTVGGPTLPVALLVAIQHAHSAESRVVEPIQSGCRSLERENGVDRRFEPQTAEDCHRMNAATASRRLPEAAVLELASGTYLQRQQHRCGRRAPLPVLGSRRQPGHPVHEPIKTSVWGRALFAGHSKEYEVDLEAGEDVCACPFDPTPDYRLAVEG